MKAVFQASSLQRAYPLPPSKSLLHRYILAASMASGESVILGIGEQDLCEDVKATLAACKSLGVHVWFCEDGLHVCGLNFAQEKKSNAAIDCRESATTLRMLVPSLLLGGGEYRLCRKASLAGRNVLAWDEIFAGKGISITKKAGDLFFAGRLTGGEFSLPGDASSQFVSGLLFALPQTEEGGTVTLRGKIESRPYIEMTRSVLRDAGIETEWIGENRLSVAGRQIFHPIRSEVEPDASAKAYLDTLFLFADKTPDRNRSFLQGDAVYAEWLERRNGGESLFDLSDTPDLAPIFFAYAGTLTASTVFIGTHRLRLKESDRIDSMQRELEKFGIRFDVKEDSVTVTPPEKLLPPSVPLDAHGDHRVAMALSVLLTKTGGSLCGAESVGKSDPRFYERLQYGGISPNLISE